MKASDLFAKCLVEEGVEYVFSVPGEENLDLLESLRKTKIKVIITRHEQAAAFMAATYGRLTGKVGVCLSTLGPGATNLVTGIAHAQLGGMPVLAITGQKGIRENWQADFQVIDVVNMLKPLTKRAVQIQAGKQIPKEIREAFKLATAERQGVCHIELPEDIAKEQADTLPMKPFLLRRPNPDEKIIEQAATLIRTAKLPLIIVSSRGQRNRVHESLRKFCDAHNIYVIQTQLGKGALGDDHKNSLYAFGIHKRDYVSCVVDRADVVITVGYSATELPPAIWNREGGKTIVHVDFTPAKTDTYYNPRCEVIGDIASALDMLSDALKGYKYDDDYCKRVKKEIEQKNAEGNDNPSFPMRPRRIVADCRKALGKEDIICMDNGIYKLWFSRHYKTYAISTFLLDNTLATMGAGLPSAIAAKIVHPERKVLAVCGDGGFMMNSQEMETAVRLGLNVVVLILNDNAYGFIKWKQQAMGFADFALDYGNPDFVKYAEAYGAKGYKIKKAAELLQTLEKAFKQKGPVIIECAIDYSENKTVFSEELAKLQCPI
ncbi:MAG: acetolactate synthase large subunit [Nanoarchaeota archaeon]|nr:acetolactate synthase large subunit [Nanoarchaeota archaeon]